MHLSSKKFGAKTFEFKIWGRNDYKDVVTQLYNYLTDFENEGFVFMINKNKSSIDSMYIDNLKREETGYIDSSFKVKNLEGFSIYISKHKIHTKIKTIYHFIFNIY